MTHDNFANDFQFFGAFMDEAIGFETAYAENNLLYMVVASLANEGLHSIYSCDISTNTWTFEYAMPDNDVSFKNMWTMGIEVGPASPNVCYLMETQPYRAWKDNLNVWHSDILGPYNAANFHADIRSMQIGYVDPDNTPYTGNLDRVYWGTDGGLSMTNGNTISNLNGQNFWTCEVYDVDVSLTGRKRIAAGFDNGLYGTTATNLWTVPSTGDGFDAIYDKRFTPQTPRVYSHNNSSWSTMQHPPASPLTALGGIGFSAPVRLGIGEIDDFRPFDFPHAFDQAYMYAGNRNLLRSASGGYATWDKQTITGVLDGTATTVNDHCRAIAVSPYSSAGQAMYFGLRLPDVIGGVHRVVFARSPTLGWQDKTPTVIANGSFNLTDIIIDPEDQNRIFISMGMVRWAGGGAERVYEGIYNPTTNVMTWTDMSANLPQLPVTCLVYQKGTDDVIYAGTDCGVYRWDKPQQCWVKFDDAPTTSGKAPNFIVHDLEIDYCSGRLVAGSYSRGVWESDLYFPSTFPGVTEIISANTTWNVDKIVTGSVLINSGKTLTITGTPNLANNNATSSTTTIHMPKWGKILVEKGAKLVVDGAHITNDCGVDWMGIYAYGDGGQPQVIIGGYDVNHGIVEIKGHSIIENAEEALNNGGGTDNPNTGGIIMVEGSHFINNHRSAGFYQYYNAPGGILSNDLSYFNDNLFDIDDNIAVPFYAHISMWDVRGISITQNIFNNNQTISISNLDHHRAIYSLDASYKFYSNYVNNFYKGIESDGSAYTGTANFPIRIQDNHFDKNEIGVHLLDMSKPVLSGNDFKIGAKQTPTPIGQTAYYSLGTKMENVMLFDYSWNYLTKVAAYAYPGLFLYTAGTEIYNTGQNFENVTHNSYKDLLIGNDGDMTCVDGTGNNGLNYSCNTNENNELYDFIFQANPKIRKWQTGFGANTATGNIITTQNLTCASWNHVTGGNGPVKYYYNPVLNETLNGLSFNVNTVSTNTPSGCEENLDDEIDGLERFAYEELSENDLNEMKSRYRTYESAHDAYNTLYMQMLDDGNTPALVNEIRNATIAEQLTTRAELLSISPYVTRDALIELAKNGIVSNPILLEILIANPEATRDEPFLRFIENDLPNPMPAYMIDLIKASWSGQGTARSLLEQNLSTAMNGATHFKTHILRAYLLNPALKNNDSLNKWLQKIPNIRNTYELIDNLSFNGDTTSANNLLNSLPVMFKLTAVDSIEYDAFVNLFTFKKLLKKEGLNISKLDSTQKAQLQIIANANDYSFPRSMARGILCFFYQICYPDTIKEVPANNLAKANVPNGNKVEKSKEINIYPNPANDHVICYYNLMSKLNEAKAFIVTDITGKQIYKAELKGMEGQHIWDTRNVGNGNYLYMIITSTGEKYSGKITIQK